MSCKAQAFSLWGTPAPNSLYLGMWSRHFTTGNYDDNNEMIALVYKSWFAGTLVNSFDERAYAAGIQRNLFEHQFSHNFNYSFGYRAGLLRGGDRGAYAIEKKIFFLPFAQILSDLSYRRFGWEISYTYVVISTSFYIKF